MQIVPDRAILFSFSAAPGESSRANTLKMSRLRPPSKWLHERMLPCTVSSVPRSISRPSSSASCTMMFIASSLPESRLEHSLTQ